MMIEKNKKSKGLEDKLYGFEKATYEDLVHGKYVFCGYVRIPHHNHKGIVQGYCSLKKSNCLRFKDYMIGENCNYYKKIIKNG